MIAACAKEPLATVKDKYGTYSCRIGGATAIDATGISHATIHQHGNWKSDTYKGYIASKHEQSIAATCKIFGSKH